MAFNPAAAHARRDSLFPEVKKHVETGLSFMAACDRAGVAYATAYTWTKTYRDWNELMQLVVKLKEERHRGLHAVV